MRHHSKQFHQTQVTGVCGDTYFVRSFRSNGMLLILLRDVSDIIGVYTATNLARRKIMAGHLYKVNLGQDEFLATTLHGAVQAVHSQMGVTQQQATRRPFGCVGASEQPVKAYLTQMRAILRKLSRLEAQVKREIPAASVTPYTLAPSLQPPVRQRPDAAQAPLSAPAPAAVGPSELGFAGLVLPVSAEALGLWAQALSSDDKQVVAQTVETVVRHLGHAQATQQRAWASDKIRRVVMERRMRSFLELFDLIDPEADLAPQGA